MTNNFFKFFSKLGLNENIIFENRNALSTYEQFELPHSEYDGISGLLHLLKMKKSIDSDSLVSVSSVRSNIKAQSLLRKCIVDIGYLFKDVIPTRSAFYSDFDHTLKNKREKVEFIYFNSDDVISFTNQARREGVSFNSFFLYKFNDFVVKNYNLSRGDKKWMVPVSLYESIDQTTDFGNNSSFVEASIGLNDTVQTINMDIKKQVKSTTYQSPLRAERLLLRLPMRFIPYIIRTHFKRNLRLGSFSNLGLWKIDTINSDEMWAFSAPVTPNQPLTFSILTLNGQMSVGIRVYEELGLDKLGERFRSHLLMEN
jgi:hypothetical protein